VVVPEFAVVLILNEPFPVRFAGFMFVIDNHVTLLETDQVRLEVTFTVVFVDTELGFHALPDKVRVPDTGC